MAVDWAFPKLFSIHTLSASFVFSSTLNLRLVTLHCTWILAVKGKGKCIQTNSVEGVRKKESTENPHYRVRSARYADGPAADKINQTRSQPWEPEGSKGWLATSYKEALSGWWVGHWLCPPLEHFTVRFYWYKGKMEHYWSMAALVHVCRGKKRPLS